MRNKRTTAILAGCALAAVTGSTAACSHSISRPPAQHATSAAAAATAGCPSGMSPDDNGVCQPGGITPASPAPAPTTAAPTTPAPTTPAITVSEQQAVDAAQNYLSLGTGFSYTSLLNQLTSQYGSGLSQADATFAIRYLHPDWYQQAVEAAKGYMNLGTGFSRASLIAQLTSPYGNGFTYNQAAYAAGQVGL